MDSLSLNVEQNNKLMIGIQSNIEMMSKQLNNMRLIITEEEKKNDEIDDIKLK